MGLLDSFGSAAGGLLSGFGNVLADNSNTLLGYGLGGASGLAQGMQMDASIRKQTKDTAALKAGLMQFGLDPVKAAEMAQSPAAANLYLEKLQQDRAQDNADRSYRLAAGDNALAREQFNFTREQAKAKQLPTWGVVSDDGTNKEYGWIDAYTKTTTPGAGSSAAPRAPANPYATGGKVDENTAAMFADRAAQADNIALQKESVYTDGVQSGTDNIPLIGKYLTSDEYGQAKQAKEAFIAAILRKESGASIQPDEFARYDRIFFPQPEDKGNVKAIEQKRAARQDAVKGLMRASGRNYKPPEGWQDPNAVRAPAAPAASAAPAQPSIGAGRGTYGASAAPGQRAPAGLPSGSYNWTPGQGTVPAR